MPKKQNVSTAERQYTAKACAIADAALGPHLDHVNAVSRSVDDPSDDDVLQAVHEVMRRRTPKQYADDDRLSHALDDSYNEITSALKEAALIIGIQIGRTLVTSEPNTDSALAPAAKLGTDAYGQTIGDRLDRITSNLALIHASATMLRKEAGGTELHDGEIIEAIERVSSACMADLWWIECADKGLLDKPAPTADEQEAAVRSAAGGAR